ncbi:MAG: Crp/Fnr family transcriptional regulator [Marinovum algicola]|uniref:Crp/Fnr family transcriptional regulator n=1 Tax=Alphaproteobacteria TaxID=28211 RepID=UPI0032EF7F70
MPERKDIHNSDVPIVCRACEARHKGICGALSGDELQRLSKHTVKRTAARKQELIHEEDEVHTYSNILSGAVKLTKLMPDGRQQIVGLQFAPDFLGRPFVSESNFGAEVAADVKLCTFPKDVLETMLADNPELENRLLRQVLKELDEARRWMLVLGRMTAKEKVASFLSMIADHIDPEHDDESVTFELPLSRAEIADYLGLTIETVSRQFTALRKDGVIEIEGNRHIVVSDREVLKDATGSG